MIDKVVVFTGSKKDFEIFLEKQIPEDSETMPFMNCLTKASMLIRIIASNLGRQFFFLHVISQMKMK